jgi:hypothetical protein
MNIHEKYMKTNDNSWTMQWQLMKNTRTSMENWWTLINIDEHWWKLMNIYEKYMETDEHLWTSMDKIWKPTNIYVK